MELESFAEVGQSFVLASSLAGDVDFETLGDEPVTLLPDVPGEGSFHGGLRGLQGVLLGRA